jgi:hypothetical protein
LTQVQRFDELFKQYFPWMNGMLFFNHFHSYL